MSELLVHYLAVAEFDVDKGCVLSAFYPESLQCNDEDYLAHLAFPDGCHLFREDWNYFVYRKGFKNLTETNAATSPTTESHEVTRSKYGEFKSNKDVELWGVAQFRFVLHKPPLTHSPPSLLSLIPPFIFIQSFTHFRSFFVPLRILRFYDYEVKWNLPTRDEDTNKSPC